jgi:ABC-type sugar transport system permease subunit
MAQTATARLAPLRHGISAWVFLLPAVAFFVGYQVYPIFRVLWISFTDYEFLSDEPARFIGFDNYTTALNDPLMWASLWRATLFTIMLKVLSGKHSMVISPPIISSASAYFWSSSLLIPLLYDHLG